MTTLCRDKSVWKEDKMGPKKKKTVLIMEEIQLQYTSTTFHTFPLENKISPNTDLRARPAFDFAFFFSLFEEEVWKINTHGATLLETLTTNDVRTT